MRQAGLRGVRRGRPFVTTTPDPAAARPPDLVNRDFRADAPNRLWVVDFTYVPTWSGMAFTAFVSDVFSRRIVGWRTARRCRPSCRWTRWRWRCGSAPGPVRPSTGSIHHSDAGSPVHRDPLRRAARRRRRARLDRHRRRQLRQCARGIGDRAVQDRVRPPRRPVQRRRRARTGHRALGVVVQHCPAARLDRLRPARRVRAAYYRQINPQQQPLLGEPSLY